MCCFSLLYNIEYDTYITCTHVSEPIQEPKMKPKSMEPNI